MTEKTYRGRVLFISSQPFLQWRGSPIRVSFNVRSLAELGYRVDLLTLPVGEEVQIPGVRVIRAPNLFRVKNVSIGPSPVKAAFDGVLFFMALALALRNRYAVIHGVEDAGAVASAVAGLTRARRIFEIHSDTASHRKGCIRNRVLWLYSKVERATIRSADAVIATGPGVTRQVQAAFPDKRVHHIFDIPSSTAEADAGSIANVRAELRQSGREKLVLYVGSFAVYQGVDLLFEAIPAVLAASPDARFIVIGGSEGEIAARRKALPGRAADSVSFLGKIPPDQLPNYLAAADVLLSPRLAGMNTPLKLLDYLKAGRAIVATNTEANRLLLDDSMAVLVEPEPAALATGISRVLADDELRAGLGEKGRRLIREKYNYAQFKRLLGACYEEVLA